ncbi:hypothetical protein L7F22_041737 [Adiantum nelumboides]|nr:hypothetical protein [Adiantum nelumboides]
MPRNRVIPTVRVVHVCPPIMVHTDLSNFQTVVQELTGKTQREISTHNGNNIADLTSCHVCHHDPHRMQTIDEEDIIQGSCLKDAAHSINQCSSDDSLSTEEDVCNIGECVRESFLNLPKHDGCLSPDCSTNSSSSNNSTTYNEVTSSSLINMIPDSANEEITCFDMQIPTRGMPKRVTSNRTPQEECSDGISSPSKRAKLSINDTNCHNPESHFNYVCGSMEQILSHHGEESALISGFITPPLFSLNDEQLIAEFGDHDILQDLYDMEIFPVSGTCTLPG